jgi:transcriptional regulator with XRE-family HTH domain
VCMATDQNAGTSIRRARERKRWTQRQLADALGVNIKTVDNWENGRTSPKSSIGAIEDVLGVSLTEDGAPPSHPPRESLREQVARIEELTRALRAQMDEEDPNERASLRRKAAAGG